MDDNSRDEYYPQPSQLPPEWKVDILDDLRDVSDIDSNTLNEILEDNVPRYSETQEAVKKTETRLRQVLAGGTMTVAYTMYEALLDPHYGDVILDGAATHAPDPEIVNDAFAAVGDSPLNTTAAVIALWAGKTVYGMDLYPRWDPEEYVGELADTGFDHHEILYMREDAADRLNELYRETQFDPYPGSSTEDSVLQE